MKSLNVKTQLSNENEKSTFEIKNKFESFENNHTTENNKINYELEDIIKMNGIYKKIYFLVKFKPKILSKYQLKKIKLIILDYKNSEFPIKDYDSDLFNYISNYIRFPIEEFILCISSLCLSESQIQKLNQIFSYSEIFKFFKKVVKRQNYEYRVISLLLKLINNPKLCFNNLLPILSRINMYISNGIDRNFVGCLSVLRAIAEVGDILNVYEEYFTGLISFLVNVSSEPKNFQYMNINEVKELLEVIEKLVSGRNKNNKLNNISTGIFLRLQEELFSISIITDEEILSLSCRLKIMKIFYIFTYEFGCRMFDYDEMFDFILNLHIQNDLILEYKYEFLDIIYLKNDFNHLKYEKPFENKSEIVPNDSNISLISKSIATNVVLESQIFKKSDFSDYFTKNLIIDLQNSKLKFKILKNINNLSKEINWCIFRPISIEFYQHFVKFITNSHFENHLENLIEFIKILLKNEDFLLIFTYYFVKSEYKNYNKILYILLRSNFENFFVDLRVKKRILLILNSLEPIDLSNFSEYFVSQINFLNPSDLAMLIILFQYLSDKSILSLIESLYQIFTNVDIVCAIISFILIHSKIDFQDLNYKPDFPHLIVRFLCKIKSKKYEKNTKKEKDEKNTKKNKRTNKKESEDFKNKKKKESNTKKKIRKFENEFKEDIIRIILTNENEIINEIKKLYKEIDKNIEIEKNSHFLEFYNKIEELFVKYLKNK